MVRRIERVSVLPGVGVAQSPCVVYLLHTKRSYTDFRNRIFYVGDSLVSHFDSVVDMLRYPAIPGIPKNTLRFLDYPASL